MAVISHDPAKYRLVWKPQYNGYIWQEWIPWQHIFDQGGWKEHTIKFLYASECGPYATIEEGERALKKVLDRQAAKAKQENPVVYYDADGIKTTGRR